MRGKKWGMFIWVKKGEVYLEKEGGSVSGVRSGRCLSGLVRRGKCIWGDKEEEFLG